MRSPAPAGLALALALLAPALAASRAVAIVPEARPTLERADKDHPGAPAPVLLHLAQRPAKGRPSGDLEIRVLVAEHEGRRHLRIDYQHLVGPLAGQTISQVYVDAPAPAPQPTAPGEVVPRAMPRPALADAPMWARLLVGEPATRVATDAGVSFETTSLARDGRTIIVVVGADPRDRRSAQLHFERETGRLTRAIQTRGGDSPRTLDARFEGRLGEEGPDALLPARIRLSEDEVERNFEVRRIELAGPIDPDQLELRAVAE